MPERPDRTRTSPDGVFYFLDLPEGDYSVSASLATLGKRYGSAAGKATVARLPDGGFKRAFLDLALQATTVRGRITGALHKNAIAMAEIRLKGSGERTFSDAQGQYSLDGIEPVDTGKAGSGGGPRADSRAVVAKRTVLVFAKGYRPDAKQVSVKKAGDIVSLDFELQEAR